jgi:RecA/RadA recombinase
MAEKIVEDINLNDDDNDNEENEEGLSDVELSKTDELYADFSSFLDKKMEIVPDLGVKLFLPTGVDIVDAVLGGGFPVGAFSMITGNPGSGKTMLAAKVISASQVFLDGKIIAAFLDAEEATSKHRLAMLGIVNPMIDPYNNLTIEKVFKFVEGNVLFKQAKKIVDIPSLVVWDSIANTLSEKEHEVEDVNQTIGYKARLLSAMIPRALAKCAQNNIAIVAINQLRDKMDLSKGKFAAPNDLKFISQNKQIPGGNAIKFNAFHLIEMKVMKVIDKTKFGFDGFISKFVAVKNKEFTPNIPLELVASFAHGFSNFWTNYRFLRDAKRLDAGAWNKLIDLPEKKFRTKDAHALYKADPEFRNAYDNAVKETIQTEIIDKYSVEA